MVSPPSTGRWQRSRLGSERRSEGTLGSSGETKRPMTQQRRIHFSGEDIGGELLPILTLGLYRDTLDSLREYIQNAIDAGATRVQVSIDPDVVSIVDDGGGMDSATARKAIRLGISEKSPLINVGFRGIGIYSGFNLCDSLEVITKAADDHYAYRIFFDFKRIRMELLAEQERRTQGQPPQLYLERLLEASVFMEPTHADAIEGHGTQVIMSGLLPDAYRRINDWGDVVTYLQDVVPLPFSPDFKFGAAIQKRFDHEDYRVVPLTLQIGDRVEELYRPYRDSVFRFGGNHPPQFFDLGDNRNSFGFAWVCVNDARETIKDVRIRGLLIKKFGFSISDRRYVESYFGRTVYSRRITGEIIVRHPNLVPNAARSDFENNTTRQVFLEALPRFTRAVDVWANTIQEEDRAKEVLKAVTGELTQIDRELPSVQRDRERLLKLNSDIADLDRRLKQHQRRLKAVDPDGLAANRRLHADVQRFVREALTSQLRTRRQIEREVVKSVQREDAASASDQQERESATPKDLVSLLDAYGLEDSDALRGFLTYLDNSVLKVHFSDTQYAQAISELRDYLEEGL